MDSDPSDVTTYFDRIGYAGPREPSLGVLQALVARHTAAIPFENIDVLLRRPILLSREGLWQKLVHARRGGYCFEHNVLLREVLIDFGFEVSSLLARPVRGGPDDAMTVRTHMVLRVELPEGAFLVDVGYGNLTLTAPLAFATTEAQATSHEPCRIVPFGSEWLVQAQLGDEWQSLCRVGPEAVPQIDLEIANWYTATYPTFPENPVNGHLIVALAGPHSRLTLFDARLAERDLGQKVRLRGLSGVADYRSVFAETFGLSLTDSDIQGVLATLPPDTGEWPSFFTP